MGQSEICSKDLHDVGRISWEKSWASVQQAGLLSMHILVGADIMVRSLGSSSAEMIKVDQPGAQV